MSTAAIAYRRDIDALRAVANLLVISFTLLGVGAAGCFYLGRLSGPAFAGWEAATNDWRLAGASRIDPHGGIPMLAVHSNRSSTTCLSGTRTRNNTGRA